jgi:coenzyme F420-0:L-glutamate ligase/coenzyme F420-1:gamma-L-glutamate ligase
VKGERLEVIGLAGFPSVAPGDDLARLVTAALERQDVRLRPHDVVAVAQKIVSKAEDRYVDLDSVAPSDEARALAATTGKDPRLVEVILGESRRVVRAAPNVLIVEHRLGCVMANAGVDQSNLPQLAGRQRVLLLPDDPDASAQRLQAALAARHGVDIAVLVTDSFGRPWRQGSTGVAIGAAGLPAVVDLRGRPDFFGRTLAVTTVGFADQIAAAAALVMGEADEGIPAVVVRGLRWQGASSSARAALRPPEEDLFR